MTKATYEDKILVCVCGERINTEDMESELVRELRTDTFESDMEDTHEFVCPKCHSRHTLKLQAFVEVSVHASIETEGFVFETIDEQPFFSSDFENYSVGDTIPLLDGCYRTGKYEYLVVDGKLDSFYNPFVDDNQLSLFEDGVHQVA